MTMEVDFHSIIKWISESPQTHRAVIGRLLIGFEWFPSRAAIVLFPIDSASTSQGKSSFYISIYLEEETILYIKIVNWNSLVTWHFGLVDCLVRVRCLIVFFSHQVAFKVNGGGPSWVCVCVVRLLSTSNGRHWRERTCSACHLYQLAGLTGLDGQWMSNWTYTRPAIDLQITIRRIFK